MEAGAEMLSEAITLGTRADWAIEVGAETDETGGEVADKAGDCAVTIPAKDSILWDPSLSTAAKTSTRLASAVQEPPSFSTIVGRPKSITFLCFRRLRSPHLR